nr:glutaminyl-peptide cyclotransferase [Xanthomonas oryzae]
MERQPDPADLAQSARLRLRPGHVGTAYAVQLFRRRAGASHGSIRHRSYTSRHSRSTRTDVRAYDAKHDRLFVTGKRWPKIYEIKLAQ